MTVTVASEYRPHPKQVRAHRLRVNGRRCRYVVLSAGVRGGKSISGAVEFLDRIYEDLNNPTVKKRPVVGVGRRRTPRLRYWVVAPTMPLTRFAYEYLLQFTPAELIQSQSQSDYTIWLLPDILVEFKTGERPDLLVGASVNGMLLDEAARIKAECWRGALRGRLTDTKGWVIFASSPLGGRNNWLWAEMVSKAGIVEGTEREGGNADIASFSWMTRDNPHIDPAEIEKARNELPEAWFLRDFEASWESFGGLIYPEFDEKMHVVSEKEFRLKFRLPNQTNADDIRRICERVVAGVDFGHTSPGCIVVVGRLSQHKFVVLEESYASGRPITGHGTTWVSEAARLREKWGVSLFACDPARPDAITDMAGQGIPTVNAFNDVYLGIRRVAEALHPVTVGTINGHEAKEPGMYILDQCRNGVRELRNYQWAATKDQSGFMEKPADDQSDHFCDALRYAIAELRPVATKANQARH